MKRVHLVSFLAVMVFLISGEASAKGAESVITGNRGSQLVVELFGTFNEPWAMTFLANGNLLVTEKPGKLLLIELDEKPSKRVPVKGVPDVAYGGQGGMGDIILHPRFNSNQWVYLSYAEQDSSGRRGAIVIRAKLDSASTTPRLVDHTVIWRQHPKVTGSGHYSHRLAFGPDGALFITSGERQKQQPAQSWSQNLGKIIRLNDDGSVPLDNPFQNKGALAKTFWTLGHRNMLGIAVDGQGRLWAHEMGPRDGDELNRIIKGENYGWPLVSWGNHYSGIPIPDHDTRPEFHAPELYWVPTIAPSGMIIYSGRMFSSWRNNAIIGGLRSESLIRVTLQDNSAEEVERFPMGKRIREVEEGPDGAIWILEDKKGGRLLRLTPNP